MNRLSKYTHGFYLPVFVQRQETPEAWISVDSFVADMAAAGFGAERFDLDSVSQIRFECSIDELKKCLDAIVEAAAANGLAQSIKIGAPKPTVETVRAEKSDCNFDMGWARDMAILGVTIVVVETAKSDALWAQSDFAVQLGNDLDGKGLGRLDSSQWLDKIRFFFHSPTAKLKEALELIQADLDRKGLLPFSKIGFAEPGAGEEGLWRTFYPQIQEPRI